MTAAILAISAVIGCNGADEDEGPPVRATYEFKGTIDPTFIGNWIGTDKMSNLDLKEDGSVKIMAAAMSVTGRSESKISGEWRVESPSLLLRYKANGSEVTLKYQAELKGDDLVLIQAGNNHKNSYRRKKPS